MLLASFLKVPTSKDVVFTVRGTENRRFRQPRYRSTPPPHRNPCEAVNIRIHLLLSET